MEWKLKKRESVLILFVLPSQRMSTLLHHRMLFFLLLSDAFSSHHDELCKRQSSPLGCCGGLISCLATRGVSCCCWCTLVEVQRLLLCVFFVGQQPFFVEGAIHACRRDGACCFWLRTQIYNRRQPFKRQENKGVVCLCVCVCERFIPHEFFQVNTHSPLTAPRCSVTLSQIK
jgi:hypothetical protein